MLYYSQKQRKPQIPKQEDKEMTNINWTEYFEKAQADKVETLKRNIERELAKPEAEQNKHLLRRWQNKLEYGLVC